MRILLINPPHPAIGSRIPREQLPPLGLLSIGGPLIDTGHHVELIDAEFGPMAFADIVAQAVARAPDAVLLGHSGSTSGHPVVSALTCAALNEVTEDRAPNCVVESEAMSLVEIAAIWAVPRPAICAVPIPDTWEEVMAPICALVRAAKPVSLSEPIWVLVRALTTLVDSAATSVVLSPFNVEVDSAEA